MTSPRVPHFLLLAIAAGAVSALAPERAASMAFIAVQVAVVGAVVMGVRRRSPASIAGKRAEICLALGVTAVAVADAARGIHWWLGAGTTGQDWGDLACGASYLLLGGALLQLLRQRRSRHDVDATIDGCILSAAVTFLGWQVLIEPRLTGPDLSTLHRLVAAAYPALDAALLFAALRLAPGTRHRVVSWWLLVAGFGLAIPLDGLRAMAVVQGNSHSLWRFLAIGVVPRALLAGAVLHPSIAQVGAPPETPPAHTTTSRFHDRTRASLLLLPLLAGPALLLVGNSEIGAGSRFAAIGSLAVAVVVVARLAQLNHEVSTVRAGKERQDRWFESLVRHAKDAILVLDAHGRVKWLSPGGSNLLGFEPKVVVGARVFDYLHPEHRTDAPGALAALVAAPGESRQWQVRIRNAHGDWRQLEVHAVNLLLDPVVQGIVVNERDVTEWHEADLSGRHRAAQQDAVAALSQRALEGAEAVTLAEDAVRIIRSNLEVSCCQFFRLLPEHEMLLLEAVDGGECIANQVGSRPLPYTPGTQARFTVDARTPVITGNAREEDRFAMPPTLAGELVASSMSVAVTGRDAPHGVLMVQSAEARLFSAADALFFQAVANALALALERRHAEDQTRHQALHDTLTGLPNRALFLDRLHLALARAERNPTSGIAVLFLDLDHFKVVNDSLGHDAGDRLLVAVAQRLSTMLRPGDTVARFGGDEFTLLCEGVAGAAEAVEIAERINGVLTDPLEVGPAEMHTSASIGIAVTSGRATRPESLLRDADAAMYRAKESGRARFELFDATMRDRALTRLRTETALRRAVGSGELELHYQPVIDLRNGSTIGAEALVRWHHPERGLVLPGEFIPVAEETGLIDSVGDWVMNHACYQAASWAAEPLTQGLVVTVNVSARALTAPNFASTVRRHLDDHHLDPSLVCLEITENVLMGNVELSLAALRRLKDLGVAIAIDDFGTGYSSLAYLKRFPVDVLKVDQSFVDGLGQESEDSAIVEAVITLARTLGLIAIAEGVETRLQLAELRNLGCDLAQGFYFSPAKPVDEFELELLAPPVLGGIASWPK